MGSVPVTVRSTAPVAAPKQSAGVLWTDSAISRRFTSMVSLATQPVVRLVTMTENSLSVWLITGSMVGVAAVVLQS